MEHESLLFLKCVINNKYAIPCGNFMYGCMDMKRPLLG